MIWNTPPTGLRSLQEKLKQADHVAQQHAPWRCALCGKRPPARLEQQLCEELRQLDMLGIQFVCQFEPSELGATGMDQIRFLMSANAGEALKPMSKVASGGEFGTHHAGHETCLAEQDAIATLIFDEVDAGVLRPWPRRRWRRSCTGCLSGKAGLDV